MRSHGTPIALAAALALLLGADRAAASTIYAVSGGQLLSFDASTPNTGAAVLGSAEFFANLPSFGGSGIGVGPASVAVGPNGDVFVAASTWTFGEVLRFSPAGTLLGTFVSNNEGGHFFTNELN